MDCFWLSEVLSLLMFMLELDVECIGLGGVVGFGLRIGVGLEDGFLIILLLNMFFLDNFMCGGGMFSFLLNYFVFCEMIVVLVLGFLNCGEKGWFVEFRKLILCGI